jgi:hypothetical protein
MKLRFFAGMTLNEGAEASRLSLRTANRQWALKESRWTSTYGMPKSLPFDSFSGSKCRR